MISISVGLLIAELALRYVGRLQKIQKVEKVISGWGWENSPLRYLQPHSAKDEVNQLGLRGQPIKYDDEDFIILLVGDSQVEAAASPINLMPESLLQKRLTEKFQRPVKVFSIAASGWGQDQQLLALQKYFKKYRADEVLVWATPVNDFWENAHPDRSTTTQAGNIKPSFLLLDNQINGPYFASSGYYYHSALFQFISQIYYQSSINQLILNAWPSQKLMGNEASTPDNCRQTTEIYQDEFFKRLGLIDLNKRYTIISPEDIVRGRSHFSPQIIPLSAVGSYQIELTKQLLKKMQQLTLEHDSKFFVFYPVREDLDERMKTVQCIKTLDEKYFEYRSNNVTLLEKLELKDSLKIVKIKGGDENIVSKEDRHLNARGNQKVMDSLANSMLMN